MQPLAGYLTFALLASVSAADAADDFPLSGNYTLNAPCKGDGSDPSERQVEISPQHIVSKAGTCTFLMAKRDGNAVEAQVVCPFPRGPLVGDVTFTMRSDNVIDFADHNQNYRSVLYRCPS